MRQSRKTYKSLKGSKHRAFYAHAETISQHMPLKAQRGKLCESRKMPIQAVEIISKNQQTRIAHLRSKYRSKSIASKGDDQIPPPLFDWETDYERGGGIPKRVKVTTPIHSRVNPVDYMGYFRPTGLISSQLLFEYSATCNAHTASVVWYKRSRYRCILHSPPAYTT